MSERWSLTEYEKRALEELYDWKYPKTGRLARLGNRIEMLIELAIEHLPLHLVEQAIDKTLPALHAVSNRTVFPGLILRRYRRKGHSVKTLRAISRLSLADIEAATGTKHLQEVIKGGTEGAAAGFYGGVAIPADVAAVLGLALRTANVFAYSYGFDPRRQRERAVALQVLELSSTFGPKAKKVTQASLTGLQKTGETQAAKKAAAKAIEKLPVKLTVRMTAMKSKDVVPVISAVIGGGFNAYYLRRVATNARFAYRELWLERRHGRDLLDAYGL
jgi:hypothetical protein